MAGDRNILSRQRFNTVNWVLVKSLEGWERWSLVWASWNDCQILESWITREASASDSILQPSSFQNTIGTEIWESQSWSYALTTAAVTTPLCWWLGTGSWRPLQPVLQLLSPRILQNGMNHCFRRKPHLSMRPCLPTKSCSKMATLTFDLQIAHSGIYVAGPYWNSEH